MQVLIISFCLLTLLAIVVVIATGGHPLRIFKASGETAGMLSANRGPLFWTTLCVVLILGFLFYFYTPPAAEIGPAQPIAFSHHVHAGVKAIDCRFCHPDVARSHFPGMPPVEKCLYCHKYIIANHPEILKEHQYFNSGTPTPWIKVFYLPEHVLFNHQRHIKKEVACEQCHGLIKEMDRIKGRRLKMGFCLQCHRERKVNIDCWLACHS